MSPINKIVIALLAICILSGILVSFLKKEEPVKIEEVKKGKIERRIEKKKDGSLSIFEIETYDVSKKSEPVLVKNYLLGLTISYRFDLGVQEYNLIFGKMLFKDIYLIGKINHKLNHAEVGMIWIF